MAEIKEIAIIGAGALGLMYMESIFPVMGDNVYFLADAKRKSALKSREFIINGENRTFAVKSPSDLDSPPDLVLVCVKNHHIQSIGPLLKTTCGPGTIVLSVLNGISSEKFLEEILRDSTVLYCAVLGMDAVKEGDTLTYKRKGRFLLGTGDKRDSEDLQAAARFLPRCGLPCEIPDDIHRELWFKWMINMGINQPSAILEAPYAAFQTEGPARDLMNEAMEETIAVARASGINLGAEDIKRWYSVLSTLSPDGKTSMVQDMEAGRKTEVEYFSGELMRLAGIYGVPVPVNRTLFRLIRAREELSI